MKRMMWMAVAAVGVLLGAELAQAAGPGPRAGDVGNSGPIADGGGRYGLHPILGRGLWGKKSGCDTCGDARGKSCGAGGCGAQGPQQPAAPLQGTLVFPVNPYLRSPRDFFMTTPR